MRRNLISVFGAACVSFLLSSAGSANAQPPPFDPAGDAARAANKAILLGVTQGIQSLPPTSGQVSVFRYDPSIDTSVEGALLGPTVLRSAGTIGEGVFDFRVAASYFEISKTAGFDGPSGLLAYDITTATSTQPSRYSGFGMELNSKTWVFNMSATYGILDNWDVSANVPLVNTHASASTTFPTENECPQNQPGGGGSAGGFPCDTARNYALDPPGENPLPPQQKLDADFQNDDFQVGSYNLTSAGLLGSGDGIGLGRVSVSTKYSVATASVGGLGFAVEGELFFPSPDSDRYAGPNSWAITPRLIGAWRAADQVAFLLDVGYDYDFENAELRRFAWNLGVNYAFERFSADLGVGGSEYASSIDWVSDSFVDGAGNTYRTTDASATEFGTTYVSLLFGGRAEVYENVLVSAAVNLPLAKQGVPPDVLTTLAIEYRL